MIRSLAVATLMVSAITAPSHTVTAEEFELRISGSAGLQFSGHYSLASADGTPQSTRLAGKVPATYRWSGDAIRIQITNASHAGTLTLELYRNGQLTGKAMAQGDGGRAMVSTGEPPGHWSRHYGGVVSHGYGGFASGGQWLGHSTRE